MDTIIFATGNKNKMIEIRMILADLGCKILSQKEVGIQADVVEDGQTFEENALIKATTIADIARKMPEYKNAVVLADDSGLEVDFVIRCQGKSTLVKATPSTGNTKSLKTLLQQPEKYQVEQAIQLTTDNVSRKGQILELPLYFGFLVGSY